MPPLLVGQPTGVRGETIEIIFVVENIFREVNGARRAYRGGEGVRGTGYRRACHR